MNDFTWLINEVLSHPAHGDIRVEKDYLDYNSLQSYKSILADLDGQKCNYRITVNDGRDIHIKEYDDCYLIHWDYANPSKDPIKHLKDDAPHWILPLIVGTATAVIAGYLAYKYEKNLDEII